MKRILVSAGHMRPMQPGTEHDTGAPDEANIVARIQRSLVRLLEADPHFEPLPFPSAIPRGTTCDAALFLHCDGFSDPHAGGFSFGFPVDPVNARLATLIGDELQKIPGHPKHRQDNGTTDEARYFGFRMVDTPGPEVLVEHGFTTNPAEHRWMLDNIDTIARAEHAALQRFFGVANGNGNGAAAVADHGPVTPASALLAAPRAKAEKAAAFLLAQPHGEYNADAVHSIVGHYYKAGPAAGLDPLLLVAQMSEETAHLTSFWSQRPRRNPAGIGVTGEPGKGVKFPSWEVAVRAHTGRLLAYAIPKGGGNAKQKALIAEALSFRGLPDDRFGSAPTLAGLSTHWATDSQYAAKIAAIANRIRG